jgi:hypothetical protein
MAGDGGVSRCYLAEGIVSAVATLGLVGGYVAWCPPPPPELAILVSLMYKMLDGVFVRQIWVKTLGSSLCPEPVMAGVSYVLEGIIEVKSQAPSTNLRGKP